MHAAGKLTYGVWGLGIVGKSVLRYLHTQGHELTVMDKRIPTAEEELFLKRLNVRFFPQTESSSFFSCNDYIIPSPGIPFQEAAGYSHKMIAELELFSAAWSKPLIAVTGTVGKTSVVHILSTLLKNNGIKVATGGNIGAGMLDLLDKQDDVTHGLLELSSFQLEDTNSFAPDLALWTNIYPNHLDRHGSFDSYFLAKYRILMHQKEHQKALIPLSLLPQIRRLTSRPFHFFRAEPSKKEMRLLQPLDTLYTFEGNDIVKISYEQGKRSTRLPVLPLAYSNEILTTSFKENRLLLIGACDMLGLLSTRSFSISDVGLPAHRFEKVSTRHTLTFYNDSKSSVFEATLAAVERLQPANIHLFLGGISKGVDRSVLIPALKDKVASITCFGAEADGLYKACLKTGIQATSHATLEEAFDTCVQHAQPRDTILFSPAGASFDLFENYQERGNRFKELVRKPKKRDPVQEPL